MIMEDFSKRNTSEPTEEHVLRDVAYFIIFVAVLVVFSYVGWEYFQPHQYVN